MNLRFLKFLTKKTKILILSETDDSFGPMAAAFLRDYSPSLEVVSAGMNPSESVDPMVVTVMNECLIDLSDYQPKKATNFAPSDFDAVYECQYPLCPNTIEAYREIRDFIKNDAYLFFRKL